MTRMEKLEALEARHAAADRRSGFAIAFLLLVAFLLVGRRAVEVASGPLPPGPGVRAPSFVAEDLAGAPTDLTTFRGKVVLVDFWATWCPPCVASMPDLDRVHRVLGPRGFTVVGVNQEPEDKDGVRRFVRERGLAFPVVFDPGSIRREFGVFTFPTSFLLSRDGTVCEVFRGPISQPRLERAAESLLSRPADAQGC